MAPWTVLRVVGSAIALLIALFVIATVLYALSRWLSWLRARRMGVALMPIGMRLVPLAGEASPALEARAAELAAAGFREVGRYATDRAPRATLVAFVGPDERAYGTAVEHPAMGAHLEIARVDGDRSVSATTMPLPRGARTRPGTSVISRPRATAAELLAIVERDGASLEPRAHTAEAFARDWEGAYRRAMTWSYSEGPLRHADPDLQARLTGLPVDEETAYFLRVRREGAVGR